MKASQISGVSTDLQEFTLMTVRIASTMYNVRHCPAKESYAITQQTVSRHTFVTAITLSAVSTGQLMERMAG